MALRLRILRPPARINEHIRPSRRTPGHCHVLWLSEINMALLPAMASSQYWLPIFRATFRAKDFAVVCARRCDGAGGRAGGPRVRRVTRCSVTWRTDMKLSDHKGAGQSFAKGLLCTHLLAPDVPPISMIRLVELLSCSASASAPLECGTGASPPF